jgi:hypothetical protein
MEETRADTLRSNLRRDLMAARMDGRSVEVAALGALMAGPERS